MKRTVEVAHSFEVGKCDDPKCEAVHFELRDRSGQPFAMMVIALEHMPQVMAAMRDHAYRIAVLRDGGEE